MQPWNLLKMLQFSQEFFPCVSWPQAWTGGKAREKTSYRHSPADQRQAGLCSIQRWAFSMVVWGCQWSRKDSDLFFNERSELWGVFLHCSIEKWWVYCNRIDIDGFIVGMFYSVRIPQWVNVSLCLMDPVEWINLVWVEGFGRLLSTSSHLLWRFGFRFFLFFVIPSEVLILTFFLIIRQSLSKGKRMISFEFSCQVHGFDSYSFVYLDSPNWGLQLFSGFISSTPDLGDINFFASTSEKEVMVLDSNCLQWVACRVKNHILEKQKHLFRLVSVWFTAPHGILCIIGEKNPMKYPRNKVVQTQNWRKNSVKINNFENVSSVDRYVAKNSFTVLSHRTRWNILTHGCGRIYANRVI